MKAHDVMRAVLADPPWPAVNQVAGGDEPDVGRTYVGAWFRPDAGERFVGCKDTEVRPGRVSAGVTSGPEERIYVSAFNAFDAGGGRTAAYSELVYAVLRETDPRFKPAVEGAGGTLAELLDRADLIQQLRVAVEGHLARLGVG